jgi:NAD(P)-dependent dehydrogenase (short-subunit alcohol dehydrogenase family)
MQHGNSLRSKRVVILGVSSGRLAVAEQAVSQGTTIVIASSNPERVRKAVEAFGGNAQGQTLDLADEQAVETLFTKLGAFDHLVFTAGDSPHLHNLADTDLKQPRRAFDLRYWAALSCSLPELLDSARIKDGLLPPVSAERSKP